jgi:hypothetical protein
MKFQMSPNVAVRTERFSEAINFYTKYSASKIVQMTSNWLIWMPVH